jgi:hypothetical protein
MARKIKARPWVKDPWFYGTPEGTELALLENAEDLTFREKLQWLEEASRFAEDFHEAAQPMRAKQSKSTSPFPS